MRVRYIFCIWMHILSMDVYKHKLYMHAVLAISKARNATKKPRAIPPFVVNFI